jgi:hypothetical protein
VLRSGRLVVGRPLRQGWPLGLLPLAIALSPLDVARPELLISLATAAVVLFTTQKHTQDKWLRYGWGAALALTLQLATLWTASMLSTGRYPPTSVLAFCAIVWLGTYWLLGRLAIILPADSDPIGRLSRLTLPFGVATGALAIGATVPLPSFVNLIGLLTVGIGLLLLFRRGVAEGRAWMIYAALLTLLMLYALLRRYTALATLDSPLDLIVLCVSCLVSSAFVAMQPRLPPVLGNPLRLVVVALPLLGLPLLASISQPLAALFCLLFGVHYGVAARLLGRRALHTLALAFTNAALFLGWSTLGWSDLQLYVIPLGISMLTLVQIYRREIGGPGCHALRSIVLGLLYTVALAKVFTLATPLQGLIVVPLLCVVGVGLGILLRVRSYVLIGTAFLSADLLVQLLRYGVANRLLGAIFLTALGLLVVGAMVVFSLERERILRRYSSLLGELRTWD